MSMNSDAIQAAYDTAIAALDAAVAAISDGGQKAAVEAAIADVLPVAQALGAMAPTSALDRYIAAQA